MKNKIILNLPHASTKLPKKYFKQDLALSKKEISHFNLQMTDLCTDKLFSCHKFSHIRARYSRIYCDVEKFADDNKEMMSKFGLGYIYTKDLNGATIFNPSKDYKNEILTTYYNKYHKKFDNLAQKHLKKRQNVILIDCHSFSEDTVAPFIKNNSPLPDICIGVNDDLYENEILTNYVKEYFENKGLNTKLNYPYSGSMIPNSLFNQKADNFYSIMIEVNRNLYLNNYKPNKNFNKIKKELYKLLKILEKLNLN